MRNISLGAAKKNVDAAGLEEELMKAKREAKSYANDLSSLRMEYDKMRKSSSSGSSKDSEALERAEGKLALKEAEAAAADEEIATLRDQVSYNAPHTLLKISIFSFSLSLIIPLMLYSLSKCFLSVGRCAASSESCQGVWDKSQKS